MRDRTGCGGATPMQNAFMLFLGRSYLDNLGTISIQVGSVFPHSLSQSFAPTFFPLFQSLIQLSPRLTRFGQIPILLVLRGCLVTTSSATTTTTAIGDHIFPSVEQARQFIQATSWIVILVFLRQLLFHGLDCFFEIPSNLRGL